MIIGRGLNIRHSGRGDLNGGHKLSQNVLPLYQETGTQKSIFTQEVNNGGSDVRW